MRADLVLHGLLAALWLGCALVICVKLALLGSEERALAAQRGADFKARTDLLYAHDRLQAALDLDTSPATLDDLVHQLGLPLQPALAKASVPGRSP